MKMISQARTDAEKEKLFNIATSGTDIRYTRSQAQTLVDSCSKVLDKFYMVSRLLHCLASLDDVVSLVESNLSSSQKFLALTPSDLFRLPGVVLSLGLAKATHHST